jgi:hypothetical protein
MRYEVTGANGEELGVVEADNYVAAALEAAQQFFQKESARRETGWAGKPGTFAAFNYTEEGTVQFTLKQLAPGVPPSSV